jgi:hypothetical protein
MGSCYHVDKMDAMQYGIYKVTKESMVPTYVIF